VGKNRMTIERESAEALSGRELSNALIDELFADISDPRKAALVGEAARRLRVLAGLRGLKGANV